MPWASSNRDGVRVRLKKTDGRHHETRHAECALKPLFVDDSLLNWMKCSVSLLQAFDGYYLPAANGMREHRARIVRDVID